MNTNLRILTRCSGLMHSIVLLVNISSSFSEWIGTLHASQVLVDDDVLSHLFSPIFHGLHTSELYLKIDLSLTLRHVREHPTRWKHDDFWKRAEQWCVLTV